MTAAPSPFGFNSNVIPSNNAYNNSSPGLQLVPYQPTPNQPLTPEQLNKLYNMSYAVQPHHSNMMNNSAAGSVYRQPVPFIRQTQQSIFAQSPAFGQIPIQQQPIVMPNPFSQPPTFMPVSATSNQSFNVSMPLSHNNATGHINNMPSIRSIVPQLPAMQQYNQIPTLSVSSDTPSTSTGVTALNRFQINKDVIRRDKKPIGDLIDLGNGIDDKYEVMLFPFKLMRSNFMFSFLI